MQVDRCVCFEVSFRTLKAFADEAGCGLEGLTARFGCGRGCALCIPYIRRMLETGRTSFDLLPPQPDQEQPPARPS